MQIHRFRGEERPYEVTFERRLDTTFYEQAVAKSAMMLAPHDTERLGMDQAEANRWAEEGFRLVARENGDFLTNSSRFDINDLRTFGGLLAYYAQITDEELFRITNNNPPDKSIYAGRRYEGQMAQEMHDVVRARVFVPQLWQPADARTVGFRQ